MANAQGTPDVIGSFTVSADGKSAALDGDIGETTPLDFRRTLREHPSVKLLSLNSNGGYVANGLIIAQEIHDRGLSTIVPAGSGCYSACAIVYFAGVSRRVDGSLGVHQISGEKLDAASAQVLLSDVLDALSDFGVSQKVISAMLRTAPGEIHVFTAAEVADLGINKGKVPVPRQRLPKAAANQVGTVDTHKLGKPAAIPTTLVKAVVKDKFQTTADVLMKMGFGDYAAPITSVLAMQPVKHGVLLSGMEVFVLAGPAELSTTNVPYRVSAYASDHRFLFAVALTDIGQFVDSDDPGYPN